MSIETECPKCGKKYNVSSGFEGRKVRCNKCNHVFRLGELASIQPAQSVTDEMLLPPTSMQPPLHPKVRSVPPNVAGREMRREEKIPGKGSSLGQLIMPTKNPVSIFAYYLGVGSLVCVPILGLPALICGLIGLMKCISKRQSNGLMHSLTGIILPFVGAGLIYLGWWWIENSNRF